MTFQTDQLPVATFFHADGRLRFLRCERATSTHLIFVFDDPDGRGDELEDALGRGAAIPAQALFASQRFIRRKMTETLEYKTPTENKTHANAHAS